jgi:thiamine kinase-like enzyme
MTLLTLAEVPWYLIDRGLVSPRSIVDGDLVVRDLSSRNHNFAAQCRQAPSYLLKQASPDQRHTVANEAAVYRLLAAQPSMRRHLPELHGFEAETGVLTLAYLHDATSLEGRRHGRRRPPVAAARRAGAALAALHQLPLSPWNSLAPQPELHTYLTPHRPGLEVYRTATGAHLELIRVIQGTPGFSEGFDHLGRVWTATAPTHHDARLTNFLVTGSSRVTLVDWEFGGAGDPRWDIGSVLGGYLSMWLSSIPTSATVPPGHSARLATCPLDVVQQAIRACWAGYAGGLGLDAGSAGRLVHDTVAFVAARLVQTAREAAQASNTLTGNLMLHLQVAHNMFSRPQEAAAHLLGLGSG